MGIETAVGQPLQQLTSTPNNNVQETAIVAHNNSSGQEVTTSAYMQYIDPPGVSNRTLVYTVTTVASGTPVINAITPSLWAMGDPVLAVNPNSCCAPMGPRRTYLAAIEYGQSSDGQLNVWYSDDGGLVWTRKNVAMSTTQQYFDRTGIAVSWTAMTRGFVYVSALTKVPRKVRVYLSQDGAGSFTEAGNVDFCSLCQSPTVAVDGTFSSVFLFWADWTNNQIHVASSTWQADSFTEFPALAVGQLLKPGNDLVCNDGGHAIQADSSIAVRYNLLSGRFGIVWHERGPDGSTDIRFATYTPDVNGNPHAPGTWSTPVTVNNTAIGDQWHPALDWDSSGNFLVTYYDHRDDPGLPRYRLYATKIDRYGGKIDYTDTQVTSGYVSDVTALRPTSYGGTTHTMGEYHDLWNWNNYWRASHICAPLSSRLNRTATGDEVCHSTIYPQS